MFYVTSTTTPVNFTIPADMAANNVVAQYTLEVLNVSAGTKKLYTTTSVAGSTVTFNSIDTSVDGIYSMNVYYASSPDLDTNAVILTLMGSQSVYKVTAATSVAI